MIDQPALDGGDGRRFTDLLERRDRLQGWLARLDAETDVSPNVAERVRADYLHQLRTIMGELADHHEELRERKAQLDAAVAAAEAAGAEAREALEEAELRFRIGELDADVREARRGQLDPAAEAAAQRLEDLRREAEGLGAVIEEIVRGLRIDDAEGLPVLEDPAHAPESVSDSVEIAREEASHPAPAADGDDGGAPSDQDEAEITRPAPGVKCVECGYTNDFGALYCGVCGVELS